MGADVTLVAPPTFQVDDPDWFGCPQTSSLDEVIEDMKVSALIESLPGYGKAKATKIMDELGISATRRVKGLGARQREQLIEVLSK